MLTLHARHPPRSAVGLAEMPPSSGGRYGSPFFDQAGDEVLLNTDFSDMFAIIVSIK